MILLIYRALNALLLTLIKYIACMGRRVYQPLKHFLLDSVSAFVSGVMSALWQAWPRHWRDAGVKRQLSANLCSCSTAACTLWGYEIVTTIILQSSSNWGEPERAPHRWYNCVISYIIIIIYYILYDRHPRAVPGRTSVRIYTHVVTQDMYCANSCHPWYHQSGS